MTTATAAANEPAAAPLSVEEIMSPANKTPTPDLVAAVRLEDGAQVVAFALAGLEVRAFTAEDLDERGLPRVKP